MALADTRLKIATRLVERALRSEPEADLPRRLQAFRTAYAVVEGLEAGEEGWTEDVLSAAWALAEDAWPRGGPVEEVAAGLAEAHALLHGLARPPRPRQPSRPRRDG